MIHEDIIFVRKFYAQGLTKMIKPSNKERPSGVISRFIVEARE